MHWPHFQDASLFQKHLIIAWKRSFFIATLTHKNVGLNGVNDLVNLSNPEEFRWHRRTRVLLLTPITSRCKYPDASPVSSHSAFVVPGSGSDKAVSPQFRSEDLERNELKDGFEIGALADSWSLHQHRLALFSKDCSVPSTMKWTIPAEPTGRALGETQAWDWA